MIREYQSATPSFEENKDFTSVKSFTVVNNGARK